MLRNNRKFVTEFGVDENEYYSYIESISGRKAQTNKDEFDEKESNDDNEDDDDDNDKPLKIDFKSFDLTKFERKKNILNSKSHKNQSSSLSY